MILMELIAVYFGNHKKPINTPYVNKDDFLNLKALKKHVTNAKRGKNYSYNKTRDGTLKSVLNPKY